jgi:hypothetical protein
MFLISVVVTYSWPLLDPGQGLVDVLNWRFHGVVMCM